MLGNNYKGKVESILPYINGAFVNIGQEKNGFLYLTDADNPLRKEVDRIEEEPVVGVGQKIINMIFPAKPPDPANPAFGGAEAAKPDQQPHPTAPPTAGHKAQKTKQSQQ